MKISESIEQHYNLGQETHRLSGVSLERLRTESILRRYLRPSPGVIADVGGGDGVYAFPLAECGYEVHLVDPVKLHIDQASLRNVDSRHPLKSATVGDARSLPFMDSFADNVLFFGPLYHLTEKADRLQALREAYRVLKPGGRFLSAHISRFTSLIDGVRADYFADDVFFKIVQADLETSQHSNPTNNPGYFTEAYFQHPFEAKDEVEDVGFKNVRLISVEGPVWMVPSLQKQLQDPKKQERLLQLLERTEHDTTLIGASGHFCIIAEK